jgi:hypothetical protein
MMIFFRMGNWLCTIQILGLLACILTASPFASGFVQAAHDAGTGAWGAGANAGTYDPSSFTWKPGRDTNSLINRVSFELLPLKTWVKVEGTTMKDNLEPRIKAAIPTWRELGNWGLYTRAWNGFAVDKESNRAWFFGGGHADGSNNGLYRLDAAKLQWDIEALPSDPAKWDQSYARRPPVTGSYTVYTETKAQWERDRSEYHDVDNQGKPTARHTYRSMTYDSVNQKIIMACRRWWVFDLKVREWSVRFPFDRSFRLEEDYRGAEGYMGENIDSTFDERSGFVIAGPTDNGDYGRFISWNPATNEWQDRKDIQGGYEARGGTLERRGRQWWLITLVNRKNMHVRDWWPLKLRIHDLDTRQRRVVEAKLDPRITIDSFSTKGPDGAALTYVDDWDTFVYAVPLMKDQHGIERSVVLLAIDPKTHEITFLDEKFKVMRGALPERPFHVIERNLIYFPNLHLLVWMDSGESPLYVLRTR